MIRSNLEALYPRCIRDENFTLLSEDIEELVMKAKGDEEIDLNRLGLALDGEKCFDFDSKPVRRIVYSNE